MTIARALSMNRQFFGVVEAIVVDNADKDGKEGRVKVRFPWFDDQMVTEWCRVSQPYAGPDFGVFLVPEKDTEVLVAFIHGDMRRPIILGGLYNGKDKPPTYRDKKKDEKMFKTKAGHQITLIDTESEQSILIEDASGKSRFLIDTEKNTITIEAESGKLILKGDGIEMRSKAEVTIDGSDISVTASGNMKLEASKIDEKAGEINLN